MGSLKNGYIGQRPELADFIPISCKKVLEVGCASGVFKDYFDECEYWGVECAEEAAKQAEKKLDKVLVGYFEAVVDQIPDNYFDVVVCNDVIEHMRDHDWFLQQIKKKLLPGGRLMGSLPNVRYVKNLSELIFQRNWEYKDVGVLDRTHLRFFTQKSLERTLKTHGYHIDTLQGINSCVKDKWYRTSLITLAKILLFGRDTQYLQFCFVVRPA